MRVWFTWRLGWNHSALKGMFSLKNVHFCFCFSVFLFLNWLLTLSLETASVFEDSVVGMRSSLLWPVGIFVAVAAKMQSRTCFDKLRSKIDEVQESWKAVLIFKKYFDDLFISINFSDQQPKPTHCNQCLFMKNSKTHIYIHLLQKRSHTGSWNLHKTQKFLGMYKILKIILLLRTNLSTRKRGKDGKRGKTTRSGFE